MYLQRKNKNLTLFVLLRCLNDNGPMYLFQEKNVMLMLNSPFLVRLFGTYQDEEYCYLVLELALGK